MMRQALQVHVVSKPVGRYLDYSKIGVVGYFSLRHIVRIGCLVFSGRCLLLQGTDVFANIPGFELLLHGVPDRRGHWEKYRIFGLAGADARSLILSLPVSRLLIAGIDFSKHIRA